MGAGAGGAHRSRLSAPSAPREVCLDSPASNDTLEECTEFTQPPLEERACNEGTGDYRLAWLWTEGWRARLRKSGDIVEKSRWEWRMDDMIGQPNRMPIIVAKVPGISVLKGSVGKPGRPRQKSVHWS